MIVGHNPGMEELLDVLTRESAYLTTANIARVVLPIQSWRELDEDTEGVLADLWRPKELD
jgi:phosphohistidine phosphatase